MREGRRDREIEVWKEGGRKGGRKRGVDGEGKEVRGRKSGKKG